MTKSCLIAFIALVSASASLAQPLTGAMREKFIAGGIPSCVESAKKSVAGNEKFIASAGVTDEHIQTYCMCQMNSLADRITPDEFGQVVKTGKAPDSIKTYAQEANKSCGPALLGKTAE